MVWRPTTQARIWTTYVLQTVDTAPFCGRSANDHSSNRYLVHRISYSYRLSYVQSKLFPHRLRLRVSFQKLLAYPCRHSAGFAYLCDDAGHTRPRAGRRAGPPGELSRQAASWPKKQTKSSASSRQKGHETRKALRLPLLQRHDFGFATVQTFILYFGRVVGYLQGCVRLQVLFSLRPLT